MEIHSVVLEHPILAIMRNIPLEKTVEYAGMAVRGGVSFFEVALKSGRCTGILCREKCSDAAGCDDSQRCGCLYEIWV